jgi:hypothetical protein|tara:strand:+ start:852 stop:1163 length:312 start_codon:yes stop_codon:yes gene_type:complete
LVIKVTDSLARNVFNQVFYLAIKVTAQPINMLSTGAESPPIDHLRQGYPVDAGTLRHFRDGNAAPLLKLPAGDHFFDLETKHIGYIRYLYFSNVSNWLQKKLA